MYHNLCTWGVLKTKRGGKRSTTDCSFIRGQFLLPASVFLGKTLDPWAMFTFLGSVTQIWQRGRFDSYFQGCVNTEIQSFKIIFESLSDVVLDQDTYPICGHATWMKTARSEFMWLFDYTLGLSIVVIYQLICATYWDVLYLKLRF